MPTDGADGSGEVPLPTNLSKAEYARLTLQAYNFQCSQAYRVAAASRRDWRQQLLSVAHQQRVADALFTKESVRSKMRSSLEQTRQRASDKVTAHRERMRAMAGRREELRATHAAYGKELHDRQYGSNAVENRSLLRVTRSEERVALAEKGAALAAELHKEQDAAAAARTAVAERVRQDSGFHVTRGVAQEECNARRAYVQAKREQSSEWQRSIESMREQRREEAEGSKQRVLALEAQSRETRSIYRERRKEEAQLVRLANQCVNLAAEDERQNTSRRRKAVHDWVVADRITDAPPPTISPGATFAARSTLLRPSPAKKSAPDSEALPAAYGDYFLEPGPLGLTLKETSAGVTISELSPARSTLGIQIGGLVLAINGKPTCGLSRIGVQRAMSKANWPMRLLIASCTEYSFKAPDPPAKNSKSKKPAEPSLLGLTLQQTLNGVVIKEFVPNSAAQKQGMTVGALLISVNNASTAGLTKAEVGDLLKERPLLVQTVPREVAYLFRPRGPYRVPGVEA